MNIDINYMYEALKEAKKGFGNVTPNPYVGAIIVKNGKIIGRGAHLKYGENHAEVNAIENCSESCKDADIYVTLEPCNHYGKTPPCSERIIKEGFKRVIIGIRDYNSKVDGSGIKRLRESGIEVITDILKNECFDINRHFFHHIGKKSSYFVMKSAITLDGAISTSSGSSKWITSQKSRELVHIYRLMFDAVLVGKNTVISDNPSLTVRDPNGKKIGRTPYRVVIDEDLSLDLNYSLFSDPDRKKTIVFTTERAKEYKVKQFQDKGVNIYKVKSKDGFVDLSLVKEKLYNLNILSVLVEGGKMINTSLLKLNLIDRVHIFIAPKLVGNGNSFVGDLGIDNMNKALTFEDKDFEFLGEDILFKATPKFQ
ncbi:MAG: riboflavin biosynthesis protein RibD [Candidatus Cloacimonadota bacterium]|nr:MAG: riboflavin biosynthesis protein RibD [Candidatus Cloacimonadota bacterium]PIE78888.1 MAG: riboflavin biosynthesis protein RibD [Candidatus Delongbacteria bacterium]